MAVRTLLRKAGADFEKLSVFWWRGQRNVWTWKVLVPWASFSLPYFYADWVSFPFFVNRLFQSFLALFIYLFILLLLISWRLNYVLTPLGSCLWTFYQRQRVKRTVLYANVGIFVRVGQRRGGILQNAFRTETNFWDGIFYSLMKIS